METLRLEHCPHFVDPVITSERSRGPRPGRRGHACQSRGPTQAAGPHRRGQPGMCISSKFPDGGDTRIFVRPRFQHTGFLFFLRTDYLTFTHAVSISHGTFCGFLCNWATFG